MMSTYRLVFRRESSMLRYIVIELLDHFAVRVPNNTGQNRYILVLCHWILVYALSHRECGHPRHLCHATLHTSTTGSWIRPCRRCGQIQLPVVVEVCKVA